jgi:hypothetical protein
MKACPTVDMGCPILPAGSARLIVRCRTPITTAQGERGTTRRLTKIAGGFCRGTKNQIKKQHMSVNHTSVEGG